MRTWSLTSDAPLSLRIAADVRLTTPSYTDDQIWELGLGGGDPPALSIETTYGLRARGMRIFPSFGWDDQSVTDPALYNASPAVQRFFPNYLRLALQPFPDLQVTAEYWIPDSHTLAGRLTLRNTSDRRRRARLRLHAVLKPAGDGSPMGGTTFEGVHALMGKTASLVPVIFLAGGASAEQAAHPALRVEADLEPGEGKAYPWAHVGLADPQASFDAARAIAAVSWDAAIARLELTNAGLVQVETGDPDWDAALAFSQKVALGAFVGPTARLPSPSFVLSRAPNRGYSAQGDGSDYGLGWDGQTAAHAYLSVQQILAAAPELAQGIIRNFLATQDAQGRVDWKPGLGGQRSGNLSAPLLATLAWRIYQHTEDHAFLQETFPRLLEFFEAWFDKTHDRDLDGHPEWDHTLQAAFDDWPAFVRWHTWGQGLDITKAETPDLAAYLYREARALTAMASVLQEPEPVERLQARMARLQEAMEAAWSDERACYHHLDRDLHTATPGLRLGEGKGEFVLEVKRTFDPPARILIRSRGTEGLSHAVQVFLHGRGRRGRGRVERLTERRFQWFWVFGTATSEKTYAELERIEVRGLSAEFETEIWAADYRREDQTCLLPLWAGIPDARRAEDLVRRALLDEKRFWRPFGIPCCSVQDPAYVPDNQGGAGGVWMFWNTLLGEALVAYGYLEEAADLVGRLIQATVHTLKRDHAFREAYNAEEPGGIGDRDHLWGVAPLGLFLEVLGVRLISPRKVVLRPRNPFPWPVTIRWRGLTLRWEEARAWVTFVDGQQVEVTGDGLQVVEQSAV